MPLTDKALINSQSKAIVDHQSNDEHILFVDDEELLCMTGTELLEIQGYRMKSVMDSDDALKLFKANPQDFDLLITDQTMPKMAGSELIEKLLNIR